jgi:hypothetical protein
MISNNDLTLIQTMSYNVIETYKRANDRAAVLGIISSLCLSAYWLTTDRTDLDSGDQLVEEIVRIVNDKGHEAAIDYIKLTLVRTNEANS